MSELLRHYFYYTFHSLTKYDFMAVGWLFFLSILLMLLSAFIKKKTVAYFLLLLGLLSIFIGIPGVKYLLDNYIRATEISISSAKVLKFTPTVIIEGSLKNIGKIPYSKCDLIFMFYKRSDTPLLKLKSLLHPKKIYFHTLKGPISPHESKPFVVTVDNFHMKDFELENFARCYP